jgi:hypothetical protein
VPVALVVGLAVAVEYPLGQGAAVGFDLAQGKEIVILFAKDRQVMGATIVDVIEVTGRYSGLLAGMVCSCWRWIGCIQV